MILLCISLILSLPLAGQQSVAEAAAKARTAKAALSADAPSRDQVMTLLNLMEVRKAMSTAMESMKEVMRQSAEEGFRQKVPDPTPKQLAALRGVFDDILSVMPLEEMENAIVAIYQRHLSKGDVDEMIRFYSSPTGKKLIHEQPQIMQESMQAGMAIQQKKADEIEAKIQKRIQELVEADESNKTAVPK
jgi:hypothetical protein